MLNAAGKCEGAVLMKGYGGLVKLCLFFSLPCPTPFPPQYLYSEMLVEISAPLSALLIRQLPEGGLILTGCSPPCLASMESIRIEGGLLLLLILISTWESLSSFSLMPVPQKSCVVTSVLQGRSSIFANYVLYLMMLHYVRIFRIYRMFLFYYNMQPNPVHWKAYPNTPEQRMQV